MAVACRISRSARLAEQVLFVDGMSGSGKTAVSPVLQALSRVEAVAALYTLDYVCDLHLYGKITDDAASALIGLITDQALYDRYISREVNFRPSDLTCVLNGHLGPEYSRRLSLPDGKEAFDRLIAEKPILHLMGHQMFAGSRIFFETLGERLTFVEVVRHPLSLIRQWRAYVTRMGTDATDFTVWIGSDREDLPWFASGSEAEFLAASPMDRAILGLRSMNALRRSALQSLDQAQRSRLLVVPFERFVRDPFPFIEIVEAKLGTSRLPVLSDVLIAQKIPRAVSSAGPQGVWSEKYGVRISGGSESDAVQDTQDWAYVESEASPVALRELQLMCEEYERSFLS